jgi:hypothetical protein
MGRPDDWDESKIRASIPSQDESRNFINAYDLSRILITTICVVCSHFLGNPVPST